MRHLLGLGDHQELPSFASEFVASLRPNGWLSGINPNQPIPSYLDVVLSLMWLINVNDHYYIILYPAVYGITFHLIGSIKWNPTICLHGFDASIPIPWGTVKVHLGRSLGTHWCAAEAHASHAQATRWDLELLQAQHGPFGTNGGITQQIDQWTNGKPAIW